VYEVKSSNALVVSSSALRGNNELRIDFLGLGLGGGLGR